MALKGFMARAERGTETVVETPKPVPVEAAPPRTVSPTTSVDASTELEGTLRCKETLRIDGRIKGGVECEKAVLVGGNARVHASITADEVQVAGRVEGDITARRKITLQRTAEVAGDLSTPGIVIEEGAKLEGRIVIGSDAKPVKASEPASETKKAQSSKKTVARPNRDGAPAPQPVAASA